MVYTPLLSVMPDKDSVILEKLLQFYPKTTPNVIIDATVNTGKFWAGSSRQVIGIDRNSDVRPTIVANNEALPFMASSCDVVIYDPPHVPNQGRDKQKDFTTRFGLGEKRGKRASYSMSGTYPAFLMEAFRVLKPEGILLAKITDYVHNHKYHWAHLDFVQAGEAIGFCPCDCIIKTRKAPIIDPRWKTAKHSRRSHCYWLVLRKSGKCE